MILFPKNLSTEYGGASTSQLLRDLLGSSKTHHVQNEYYYDVPESEHEDSRPLFRDQEKYEDDNDNNHDPEGEDLFKEGTLFVLFFCNSDNAASNPNIVHALSVSGAVLTDEISRRVYGRTRAVDILVSCGRDVFMTPSYTYSHTLIILACGYSIEGERVLKMLLTRRQHYFSIIIRS